MSINTQMWETKPVTATLLLPLSLSLSLFLSLVLAHASSPETLELKDEGVRIAELVLLGLRKGIPLNQPC
jgi:hypothetical protein